MPPGSATPSSSPSTRTTSTAANLTRLSYAISDANQLATLLVAQGFEPPRVLTEAAAGRADVIRELNWYARKLDIDDEFLLFYSGHGVRNPELNTRPTG